MDKELTTIRKLYNQFKKCPKYEEMSYPYFKYCLMKKLEEAKAPGIFLIFTFDKGYHTYFQVKVKVSDILKAMKFSIKEFVEWRIRITNGVSGVLDG